VIVIRETAMRERERGDKIDEEDVNKVGHPHDR